MSNEIDSIGERILAIRGIPVILDSDLAAVYGVETKALNQAVSRNIDRFPEDFSFKLTKEEWESLRCQNGTPSERTNLKSQNVTSKRAHGGRRYPPRAFTEHGALMASTILRSEEATGMSVFIIRAFVRMREELATNAQILKRLAEIDKTLLTHDAALSDLYQKLLPLLSPPPDKPKRRIGFHSRQDGEVKNQTKPAKKRRPRKRT